MNRLDEEENPLKDLKQVGKTASTKEDNVIDIIENEGVYKPD